VAATGETGRARAPPYEAGSSAATQWQKAQVSGISDDLRQLGDVPRERACQRLDLVKGDVGAAQDAAEQSRADSNALRLGLRLLCPLRRNGQSRAASASSLLRVERRF
jgi:hypothetical protein